MILAVMYADKEIAIKCNLSLIKVNVSHDKYAEIVAKRNRSSMHFPNLNLLATLLRMTCSTVTAIYSFLGYANTLSSAPLTSLATRRNQLCNRYIQKLHNSNHPNHFLLPK